MAEHSVSPVLPVFAALRRRGFRVTAQAPDLPFEPGERAYALLHHYATRLFLRGAIAAGAEPFRPEDATRYLSRAQANARAGALARAGLLVPAGAGRFRLARPARSFGGTLEWYVAEALRRECWLDAATGLRFGERGVGGDLDVVAAGEGRLFYFECKSGPPKHLSASEVSAFLARVARLRPDAAVFVMDTALRLSDKVLPMFRAALRKRGAAARCSFQPFFRDGFRAGPLYLVNARPSLVANLARAVADALRARAPEPP